MLERGRSLVAVLGLLISGPGQLAAQSVYIGSGDYLEIDRRPDTACDGGMPNGICSVTESASGCPSDCELAADANLVQGPDLADGTESHLLPPCAPGGICEYLDWSDLAIASHRIDDPIDPGNGRDSTAFPGPAACVASAALVPRQELSYAGIANNLDYSYVALKRGAGNGGAAYFWFVNQLPPTFVPGPVFYLDWNGVMQSCTAGQLYFSYDISIGDILLVGEFEPSSGATVMRTFRAINDRADLDARSALDFATLVGAGILEELPPGGSLATLNTTPTAAGSWGGPGENYDPLLFAEAAVPMQYFAGEETSCGLTYHLSVLSKPSTAASSDMKDLIGPATFTMNGCPASAPLCSEFQCNGCVSDGDCAGDYPHLPACQPSGACGQCSASNQTLCKGNTPYCHLASGTCIASPIFLDGFEFIVQ